MADMLSKSQRSAVMAAIRATGNRATELRLAKILRTHGITGWRRHQKLPGKPDFVFRKAHLAIFVDGCFWHGCRSHCRMPATNIAYWQNKISRNQLRDRRATMWLRAKGWRVLRIWEHSLASENHVVRRIKSEL